MYLEVQCMRMTVSRAKNAAAEYWLADIRKTRRSGAWALAAVLFFALAPPAFARGKTDPMALIPSGEFTMGAEHRGEEERCEEYSGTCAGDWYAREGPAHTVRVDAFFIDKHEVTQERFAKVMGSNPSVSRGESRPVDSVTWEEARGYCEKVGKRLPTEAEWEYAARAGTTGAYYWGAEPGRGHANCVGCGSQWDGRETAPAGSFPPNPWGLYDMAGNVWEWVQDWFEDDYYRKSPRRNPKGPDKGNLKVIRGGSLYDTAYYTRTAFRQSFHPAVRSDGIGFRCASSAGAADAEKARPARAAAPPRSPLFETPQSPPAEEDQAVAKPAAPPESIAPPVFPTGDLLVSVDIVSATVQVNGIYAGIARATAPLELRKMAVGKTGIRVEARGYDAQNRSVVIRAGDMTRERFVFKNAAPEKTAETVNAVPQGETGNVSPPAETGQPALQQPAVGGASPPRNMVWIPGGAFKAGADPDRLFIDCRKQFADCERKRDAFEWSGPAHEVRLDAFYIDKYEVIQADFERVMGRNPSKFKGPNLPVEMATWDEAREYCRKTGKRLPTEMEWEMAVRGGGDAVYYWGSEMEDDYSWYNKNSGLKSHPVGRKKPNALGLYDMAGNVWEWVEDWFDENYYRDSPRDNPPGPATGKTKGLRGGSYGTNGADNRSTARRGAEPRTRFNDVGFRCAMSANTPGK